MPDLTTQPTTAASGSSVAHDMTAPSGNVLLIATLAVVGFLVLVGKVKKPTPIKTEVAAPPGAAVTTIITQAPPAMPPPAVGTAGDELDQENFMGQLADKWTGIKTRYTQAVKAEKEATAKLTSALATTTALRNEVTQLRGELTDAQARLAKLPSLDASDHAALDELLGANVKDAAAAAAPTASTVPDAPPVTPTGN